MGVGRSPFRSFQMMAGQLFALALPAVTEFSSPRAWAFGLIGIHEYLSPFDAATAWSTKPVRRSLAALMELFEKTAPAGLAMV